MKREIKLKNGRVPTYEEVIVSELGSLMAGNYDLSSKFRKNFKPNANQKKLQELLDGSSVPLERTLHILLYGSPGSGKSWAAISKALEVLLSYPNTNVLGVRRTHSDIEASIFKDSLKFLNTWGVPHFPNITKTTIMLPNGSKFVMRSDKALVQAKKDKSDALGSTSFSVVILEEADSISEELADTIPARMREDTGNFRRIIFYVCNPPDETHWLYKKFFENNNPNDPASRYRALQCNTEGNEFIRKGYIEDLKDDYRNNSSLWERHVMGNFAPAVRGIPIFKNSFNLEYHVEDNLEWNPNYPVHRGWDFGFRGMAMVAFQDDLDRRQLRGFISHVAQSCLLDTFADEMILKCFKKFPGAEYIDYCDPAGVQKTGLSKNSYVDILRGKGLRLKYKNTLIEYGLSIIEEVLNSSVRGRPAMVFDTAGCRILIRALHSGYCNDKDRNDVGVVPVKDGFHDHCNTAWTAVMTDRGWVTFRDLSTTDRVWTRKGWKRILKIHDMGVRDCLTLSAEHGELTCTPEHRVLSNGNWVKAELLRSSDKVCIIDLCQNTSYKKPLSTGCGPTDTRTIPTKLCDTSGSVGEKRGLLTEPSINTSGSRHTERFLRAATYITEMRIWLTTLLRISCAYLLKNTATCTLMTSAGPCSIGSDRKPSNGTILQKVKHTMLDKAAGLQQLGQRFLGFLKTANSAAKSSKPNPSSLESIVPRSVEVELTGLSVKPAGPHRVYDLTVEECHEYFTEFGLCHNCVDAFRYMMIHMRQPGKPIPASYATRGFAQYNPNSFGSQVIQTGPRGPSSPQGFQSRM